MSSAVYTSKRLDHLGLVAGFCQEIDLAAIIDKALGTSERRQVSYGQIFSAPFGQKKDRGSADYALVGPYSLFQVNFRALLLLIFNLNFLNPLASFW